MFMLFEFKITHSRCRSIFRWLLFRIGFILKAFWMWKLKFRMFIFPNGHNGERLLFWKVVILKDHLSKNSLSPKGRNNDLSVLRHFGIGTFWNNDFSIMIFRTKSSQFMTFNEKPEQWPFGISNCALYDNDLYLVTKNNESGKGKHSGLLWKEGFVPGRIACEVFWSLP